MHDVLIGWLMVAVVAAICALSITAWVREERRRDAAALNDLCEAVRTPAEHDAWIAEFRPAMGRDHIAGMQARNETEGWTA